MRDGMLTVSQAQRRQQRQQRQQRRDECRARREEKERRTEAVRRAVFDTTELLEYMLLCLPPRDAIVCMQICKQWNECIRQSRAMAKHLMLLPSGLEVQQVLWTRELIYHPRRGATFEFSTAYTNNRTPVVTPYRDLTKCFNEQYGTTRSNDGICRHRAARADTTMPSTQRHDRRHAGEQGMERICPFLAVCNNAPLYPTQWTYGAADDLESRAKRHWAS